MGSYPKINIIGRSTTLTLGERIQTNPHLANAEFYFDISSQLFFELLLFFCVIHILIHLCHILFVECSCMFLEKIYLLFIIVNI